MSFSLAPLPADFASQLLRVTLQLALVLNIPAVITIIIPLKERGTVIKPALSTATSFAIMVCFCLAGERALDLLGVYREGFLCAGATVLMALAVELIFNIQLFHTDLSDAGSAAIIPIAFPITAGMGTLSTIAGLQQEFHLIALLLGIVFNSFVIYLGLRYSDALYNALGKKGNQVTKIVVGVLLMAVAWQTLKVNLLGLPCKPW